MSLHNQLHFRKLLLVVLCIIFSNKLFASGNYSINDIIKFYYPSEQYTDKKSYETQQKINKLHAEAYQIVSMIPDEAIALAEQALKRAKKAKLEPEIINSYNILGTAYYGKQDYEKSAKMFDDGLKLLKKTGKNIEIARYLYNLAIIYTKSGKNRQAMKSHEESLQFAQASNFAYLIAKNHEALAEIYSTMGKFKDAYHHYTLFVEHNYQKITSDAWEYANRLKSHYTQVTTQQQHVIEQKEVQLEVAKQNEEELVKDTVEKAKEIEELNVEGEKKDEEIKEKAETIAKQYRTIIYISIVIALFLVYTIMLFIQFSQKRRAYKKLEAQNKEIKEQKEEIESQRDEIEAQRDEIFRKNSEITQSINYASRIQGAILPKTEIRNGIVKDYFIFFKPRDIVSGDFYWFTETDNRILMAASDCTGHGVPGAFMSMLGSAFLNAAVKRASLEKPHEILDHVRSEIISSLHQKQEGSESKDGMDTALISIDKKTRKIEFSGANNPLYIIRNKELSELKGDRMPVGNHLKMKPFENKEMDPKKGDVLYLFSDGFADQFGGQDGKKFKYKHFKDYLVQIHQEPMKKQKQLLNEKFEEWRGHNDQIDDVLIIGILMN